MKIRSTFVFIMTLFAGYYLGQWSSQFNSLGPNEAESVVMFLMSSALIKMIFSKGV